MITPDAGTHGAMQAAPARPHWRTDAPPANTLHVVAKDMLIRWDGSEIPVQRGTLVHVAPGSPLWHAYGGTDGLHPAHRARP